MSHPMMKVWEMFEEAQDTSHRELTRAAWPVLGQGRAPRVEELAVALKRAPSEIYRILDEMVGAGTATMAGVFVTGSGGLSVVETGYRFTGLPVPPYAWCALDILGIAGPIGGPRPSGFRYKGDRGRP